tara:strand:+ start:2562 stop:3779 length:1218 start_codon:yes stop_codon:yes gene_type:complete
MPAPRLNVNGDHVGLRESGKATFTIENPSDFERLIGSAAVGRFGIVIALTTFNVEARILGDLDRLRGQLAGVRASIIFADNGSTDSTRERVRSWAESGSIDHIFVDFEREPNEQAALGRAVQLARIFSTQNAMTVALAIQTPETFRTISSFAIVATEEVADEAAILIAALRTFHAEPVFLTCDKATKASLERHDFRDVQFRLDAEPAKLAKAEKKIRAKVAVKNDFHRVDCIFAKMDAWRWAIDEAGDSLFLDADILPVANLNEGFASELVLSPHHHGGGGLEAVRKFGIFNAGYCWTSNAAAPDFWREVYLGRSDFFEQEGMNLFVEKFDVSTFPRSHNVGFWREPVFETDGLKSWHVHLTDALDAKANSGLRSKYIEHRARVFGHLERIGRRDLLEFIKCLEK